MGFQLWEEESGKKDLRVVTSVVELTFSGFCKIAACFKSGVT